MSDFAKLRAMLVQLQDEMRQLRSDYGPLGLHSASLESANIQFRSDLQLLLASQEKTQSANNDLHLQQDSQERTRVDVQYLKGASQIYWRNVLFSGLRRLYCLAQAEAESVDITAHSQDAAAEQDKSTTGEALRPISPPSALFQAESVNLNSQKGASTATAAAQVQSFVALGPIQPPSLLSSEARILWSSSFKEKNLLDDLRRQRNEGSHEATAQDLKAAILGLDNSVDQSLKDIAKDGFELITGCSWENANNSVRFCDGVKVLQAALARKRAQETTSSMAAKLMKWTLKRKFVRVGIEKEEERLRKYTKHLPDRLHALDQHGQFTQRRVTSDPILQKVVKRRVPGI
ncbi:unnamed protein product [Sympodiomycopsis kandeliae]